MAMTYQNYASLGVNLNRQKYGPLDISNVFTSEADLKYYLTKGAYKEGVSDYWIDIVPYPYEGQVLATAINGSVAVYVLALNEKDEFITQEIAGKIITDNATITVAEDGSIGLANIPVDNGVYHATFTNGVLTWEKVDNSALTNAIAENTKKITDESTTARAAEKALGERIDAIDLSPYAKTTEVETAIDTAVTGILGEGVKDAYNTLKEIQDILEGTDGETIDGLIESVAENKSAIATEKARAEAAELALQNLINAIDFVDNDELVEVLNAYVKSTDVYSKAEADKAIEDALSKATGGESAADVALALANYKKALNLEIYGNEEGTGDSRIDALETVGAEKNVITGVKVNNIEVAVDENRKVNIDLTSYATTANLEEVDRKAGQGVADAAAAKKVADANKTTLESMSGYGDRITALEGQDSNLSGRIDNVVKTLGEKATQTALDEALLAIANNANNITANGNAITANENAINNIVNNTIPAINNALNDKASTDALNNAKNEIAALIGTVAENKTVVQMIDESKYDDTTIKADILKNTNAIALLNDVDTVEGSIDNKIAKEVAKILNDNDASDIDTLNEIAAWIINDETGVAKMNADIAANTSNIAAILNKDTGLLAQALAQAKTEIGAIPTATASVLGLVKIDDATIKMNSNNQLYVNKVSVDSLYQEANSVLVLNGGKADIE